MKSIRAFLVLPAILIAVGAGLTAPTASAGTARPADTFVGHTIIGDLNNDGIPDRATLGGDQTTKVCTVTVTYGLPAGGFGAPTVHSYPSPAGLTIPCPNIGVAIKLGTRKKVDLVTEFGFGFGEVLVLRNFKPFETFHGLVQPDNAVAANLSGNGRQDIIEIGSQESALTTLVNTADGQLVRGPVFVSSLHTQIALADFQGRGAQDILASVVDPRTTVLSAQVLYGNGRAPVTLLSSTVPFEKYTVFAGDVNLDGVPDAGVIDTLNGATSIHYFVNDGRGNFTTPSG